MGQFVKKMGIIRDRYNIPTEADPHPLPSVFLSRCNHTRHPLSQYEAESIHIIMRTFSSGCQMGSSKSNSDFSSPTIFNPRRVYCSVLTCGEPGGSASGESKPTTVAMLNSRGGTARSINCSALGFKQSRPRNRIIGPPRSNIIVHDPGGPYIIFIQCVYSLGEPI